MQEKQTLVPPIGIDDFKEIRLNKRLLYIDKTDFISEFIADEAKSTLITRPRRFGKTLNLSTLKYFFDIKEKEENLKLFEGLKVTQDQNAMSHFGSRPVIFLTFKGLKASTWVECQNQFIDLLAEFVTLFLDKPDLNLRPQDKVILKAISFAKYDFNRLSSFLKRLTRIYSEYYGIEPLLLLDEYDVPLQEAFLYGYYDKAKKFFQGLFVNGFKGNPYLWRGVLTGCLRTAKESIFSDMNNLEVSSVSSSTYSKHFGLLESEVSKLLVDYNLKDQEAEVKRWYNGYNFGGTTIYNPWSILNFIKQKAEFQAYWLNTSENTLVKEIISRFDHTGNLSLEKLINYESIKIELNENIAFKEIESSLDSIWNFFYQTGYLKSIAFEEDEDSIQVELKVPNIEVRQIFLRSIKYWFSSNETADNLSVVIKSLASADIERFKEHFKELTLNTFSFADLRKDSPEKFYHGFFLGLLANAGNIWHIKSNRESGLGFLDILLIPKDFNNYGVIIELKAIKEETKKPLIDKAKEALDQIEVKKYAQELISLGTKKMLKIGIAFKGKDFEIAYSKS